MQADQLVDIFGIVLIILAVIVVAIMVIFIMTKMRGDTQEAVSKARIDVRAAREKRLALCEQALAMFSSGNTYGEPLSKLVEIYKSIDSEKKEILWEEKYIKIMRKFMADAKKKSPDNMKEAWKMLNSEVNANEEALDMARAEYVAKKEILSQFDRVPQKYIIQAGDKIMCAMKVYAQVKQVAEKNLAEQARADKLEQKEDEQGK